MPDDIKPVEKRDHRAGAGTGKPRGRPRRTAIRKLEPPPGVEPAPESPGIVQAPEVVKSEVQQVTEDLTTLYGTLGTFVMFANQYDGFIIIGNAENMAKSVVAACHQYESAWRVLKMVTAGNVWSVLVLAHLGPALAIMSNHGMVNPKVATAFRQAMPPDKTVNSTPGQPSTGPVGEEEMSPEQQQAIAQYLAEMAAQQGQATPQQVAAMFAPPPVEYGNFGANNGAVGMDSVGGLGDQDTAMARALFTAQQINSIREESLRKTQGMSQNGQTSGL